MVATKPSHTKAPVIIPLYLDPNLPLAASLAGILAYFTVAVLTTSVLAISRSLRLPYETIRRHAEALVEAGVCVRVGRRGLLVPASFYQSIPEGTLLVYRLTMDFLAELRRVGVKV